jgi:hypothetical protein
MSDPVEVPQVPVRQSLDFPACEGSRVQTVRNLCTFYAYKMLYCAEMGQGTAAAPRSAGNRLKWHLYHIEK